MQNNKNIKFILAGLVATGLGITFFAGCGKGIKTDNGAATAPSTGGGTTSCVLSDTLITTAPEYLAAVTDSCWAQAEEATNVVNFEMEKTGTAGTADNFAYRITRGTLTGDAALTFETGKPYVIKFKSIANATNWDQEHYFTHPDFWKSVAVKKVVTPSATYYAPYLNDFELNAPKNNSLTATSSSVPGTATEATVYFVPVKAGSFGVRCKSTFHSKPTNPISGMYSTVTITGNSSLPTNFFAIPSDYSDELGRAHQTDAGFGSTSTAATAVGVYNKYKAKSAGDVVSGDAIIPLGCVSGVTEVGCWATIPPTTDISVSATGSNVGFSQVTLPNLSASILRFTKPVGFAGSYALTSTNFFKNVAIRKIHDAHIQIKPYYLEKVVFAAVAADAPSVNNSTAANSSRHPGPGQLDFYVVPRATGTYILNLDYNGSNSSSTVVVQ